jgi:hypothetical protein
MGERLKGLLTSFPVSTDVRHTTAKMKVGSKGYEYTNPQNEHTYVRASGAITAYAPVAVVDQSGLLNAIESADVKGFVGVAQAAFATREYGTIATAGVCLALVPSGVSVGDPLTAGAGAMSATLTNGVRHATVLEAPVLLSGTTQVKYIWVH